MHGTYLEREQHFDGGDFHCYLRGCALSRLASKTDMLERLYDCLTQLQQQYEINREDGVYWQQTAQTTATQLAMTGATPAAVLTLSIAGSTALHAYSTHTSLDCARDLPSPLLSGSAERLTRAPHRATP